MPLENPGGGQAAATPTPTPTGTATPPAATQQTVAIPLEQLQTFTSIQARLAEMEAAQRTQQEAAQQEQARILAQKGEVENALRLLREQSDQQLSAERGRLTQVQERAKRYALDGELTRALSGQRLANAHAAEQLATLFRGQFVVDEQGDTFTVRTATYQSPADFVAQQLARPEYSHFLAPGTTGGTAGAQGAQAVQTGTPTPTPVPQNMGQAVILHMQGLQKAQGDPLANMTLPMGLRGKA